MKTIDNDYDSLARLWWSEDEGATASIRHFINPPRIKYFRRILEEAARLKGTRALDVGSGGGFLSEELAKLGLDVTGVDPSEESVYIAQEHANRGGLRIAYRVSSGESLPFPDGSFDMVFCCDVLEHVRDLAAVISEISRVLRPGGIFFFDTINRTLMSRIAVIYIMQECRFTAFVKSDMHVWSMFIKPDELKALLTSRGLSLNDLKGITPRLNGFSALMGLHRAAHKRISFRDLAAKMRFSESDDLRCSYMGYAIKI